MTGRAAREHDPRVATSVVLRPRGPFSVASAAAFLHGFPPVDAGDDAAALELALRVAGTWAPFVALLRADGDAVRAELHGPGAADREAARGELERVLSLDVDGTGFAALADRDPVVAELQRRRPGLRPVLFASPYEAAAWALLSQRTRSAQAVALRRRLAAGLGDAVPVPGGHRHAFPAPARLAALGDAEVPGLPAVKAGRLRALGAAAAHGRLDAARLRALGPERAFDELRELPGIGPFGAELVLVRGVGAPDAFPDHEPRLHAAMRTAYDLPPPPFPSPPPPLYATIRPEINKTP